MSVYSGFMTESTGHSRESFLEDVNVDDLLYGDSIEEAYEEDSYEAAMRCVAENTENYNRIMEACAITEFCYFEENGTEMVYTEGTLEDWKNSAIAFFRKVWDKIQSIFKKVLMQFASWSKNDKEFYNKYKKQLNQKANNGFGDVEVKVFEYRFLEKGNADDIKSMINTAEKKFSFTNGDDADTLEGIAKLMTGKTLSALPTSGEPEEDVVTAWTDAVKELNENPELVTDKLDKYRASLAGYSGDTTVTAKEFSKEVTEYFQSKADGGHESTKETMKLGEALNKALPFLEFSDKARSSLAQVLRTNKKSIDDAIRTVNNLAKPLGKATQKEVSKTTKVQGAQHTIANKFVAAMKQEKNILTQYNGLALNALKACSRQSKAVCVKAATYVNKDKDYKSDNWKNESAVSGSAISLLNSVEMI